MNKLAIIVPCYNEEEILEISAKKLQDVLNKMIDKGLISPLSKICFVNDGSKDNTQKIIDELCKKSEQFSAIEFSRNFGHQKALMAGLYNVEADITITIDADLQDDIFAIEKMVEKYKEGFDVVYGVREKRDTDTFFKKYTALAFYKLLQFCGVNIVYNHADFRLLSKKAIERLKEFKEKELFLRALIPLLGMKSAMVYYNRQKRELGQSKYPFFKMLSFAFCGITSFTAFPLRLISILGGAILLISIVILGLICYKYFHFNKFENFLFLIYLCTFFNGILLLSIGILGEYVNKIFVEVKARPLYEIEKTVNIK